MLIRCLTLIAALPLRIWVFIQRLRGAISADVAANRLGRATVAKPDLPLIWIHAASLGELSSVRPFLRHLVQTRPDRGLLITTNNPAALALAADWLDVPAILQAAPLDIPSVVEKFLSHWQPVAFANVETEIWPNRFHALAKRGIPCVGLNARMSEKSGNRYAKLGPSVGLQHFKAIFAQNEQSAQNFRKVLGQDGPIEVIPNFKTMVQLPKTDPKMLVQFTRSKTVLAASTHQGEEELVLAAFRELASQDKTLRLILAPRHPQRAANIMQFVRDAGFDPKPLNSPEESRVYIVQTLGQLPELYALAAVTFIGGSIIPNVGGHTPYEPIRAQSAIVTGEMTENFATEFNTLRAKSACIIATPDTISDALKQALDTFETLAINAKQALPSIDNPTPLLNKISAALNAPK